MGTKDGAGAAATSNAIDQLGLDAGTDTNQLDAGQGDGADTGDSGQLDAGQGDQLDAGDSGQGDTTTTTEAPAGTPAERVAKMLDSIGKTAEELQAEEDAAAAAAGTPPADAAKPPADPNAPAAGAAATDEDKADAEILAGIKSERGRDRVKKIIDERKALATDLEEFKGLVTSTGMDAQQFAASLEFGRLVNSGDPKNLTVALEMVESQRTQLYQMLGKEAPGVDLLAEHPDLQKQVRDMDLTREAAIELAGFRKKEQAVKQRNDQTRAQQQNMDAFNQQVEQGVASMEAYLKTRETELDHPIRLASISRHFANPENMKAFVTTYKPEQWVPTLRIMYDNVRVTRTQQPTNNQPARSQPRRLGTPAATASSPIDRVASRLDSMGI